MGETGCADAELAAESVEPNRVRGHGDLQQSFAAAVSICQTGHHRHPCRVSSMQMEERENDHVKSPSCAQQTIPDWVIAFALLISII